VHCRPIKEALANAAQQLAQGLLEHVRLALRRSSTKIGESCAALAAEVRGLLSDQAALLCAWQHGHCWHAQ
jgi:hypothetical protein